MTTYTVSDGQTQNLSLGYYDPQRPNDTINVSGAAALHVGTSRGNAEQIDINLAPNATLTGGFTLDGSTVLKVEGDASTKLILAGSSNQNGPSNYLGASTLFGVDVSGPGSLTINGSSIEFARGTSNDVSVGFNNGAGLGSATLDQPNAFKGLIGAQGGTLHLENLGTATDYDLSNGVLNIYGGAGDALLDTLRLSGDTSKLAFTHNGPEVNVYGSINPNIPVVGTALAQHVAPQPTTPVVSNPQPPATQPDQPVTTQPTTPSVLISDGTTGQPVTTIAAQPYAGPVAGIAQQVIAVTAENLNILATQPNLFIHTGSGTDAIQAASGINVLDGGTGSNFLTAGTGTDTFFVDARGAAADTWSTVVKFHAGDAATLWGVSAATPQQWADGQGAAGATGLTLHAGAAGAPTASITLAGFTTADLAGGKLAASFGHDAASGSDYLYLHAT